MYKSLVRKCKILIITSILFIILTGIAMIVYPGGSLIDKATIHYNFFENFFSDLGATVTPSGKKNSISNILFISAFGSLGVAMIYFSNIWRAISVDIHKMSLFGYLSKISMIVSGICFTGMAFTPWNVYLEYHTILLKLAFGFLLSWTMLMIILESINPKIRHLMISNIIYMLFLIYYLYELFTGSKLGTPDDLVFQAAFQKLIVYFTVVNFIVQAKGIMHFLRIADFRRGGKKNFYV